MYKRGRNPNNKVKRGGRPIKGYDEYDGEKVNYDDLIENWDGSLVTKRHIEPDPRDRDREIADKLARAVIRPVERPAPLNSPPGEITVNLIPYHMSMEFHNPNAQGDIEDHLQFYLWVSTSNADTTIPQHSVRFNRTFFGHDDFTLDLPDFTGNRYVYAAYHSSLPHESFRQVFIGRNNFNQADGFTQVLENTGGGFHIFRTTNELTDIVSGLPISFGL